MIHVHGASTYPGPDATLTVSDDFNVLRRKVDSFAPELVNTGMVHTSGRKPIVLAQVAPGWFAYRGVGVRRAGLDSRKIGVIGDMVQVE